MNSSGRIALRFDVDTHECVHKGIPFLLDAAREQRWKFCFLVNMGRAVSLRHTVYRSLKINRNSTPRATSLSSMQKLGVKEYVKTAVVNPFVGRSGASHLHAAQQNGHVLGLHGGRNHGVWQWSAQDWPYSVVCEELLWGIKMFTTAGLARPRLFSSPGWNSPPRLPEALAELGFRFVLDRHEPGEPMRMLDSDASRVCPLNTGLAGEPGGVGFFENAYANQESAHKVVERVLTALDRALGQTLMVYDHPAFCAGLGRNLFMKVMGELSVRGVDLSSAGELS